MPWYINPALTCKVLNRIADRISRTNLQDLNATLDRATELIWSKQECYNNMRNVRRKEG
ncbi:MULTISPECIES: hypothetical protein [Oryzomonas]|uniref:hypothetical protein n=1 Tax=Oryzomonas TaxID=2855184 RepID=UPI001784DEEB|nr:MULTISPECIES: hypothetical protein [Oryzomonas]